MFVFDHSFSTASSIVMEDSDNQTSSHKSEKIKSYTLKFKPDAFFHAEIHANHAAEKSTKLTEKEFVNGDRKKRSFNKLSIPRKQKEAKENVSREEEESRSAKNWMRLFLSGSMRDGANVFLCHESSLSDEMVERGKSTEDFKASVGWLRHFMKRYSLYP